MSESRGQEVHLPGLRAAGGAREPARRAAARLLRPGRAQRADRPPGAPAPREREETARMANEAYRAVFLRVHPTGKMVLSLTTESDGKEAEYAQLVADELGVPALDVKVVPADTDRFGVGHGYNTSPSEGTAGGDRRRRGEDPRQGAAARGHGAGDLAGEPQVVQRRLGARRRRATRRRSRRSRTSPSTPTAPAPCRRESRAGSTRRPSTRTD